MTDDRFRSLRLPPGVRLVNVATAEIEDAALETVVAEPVAIYRGQFVAVYGHPGSLKTFMLLSMAVRAALAGERVLWFAGEGSCSALLRRLEMLALGQRRSREALGENFQLVHGAFDFCGDGVESFLEELTRRFWPSLVVVDPMASFFSGEENSATAMQPFLDIVRGWSAAEIATVLVHHSRKSSEFGSQDLRGSSALRAAVDAVFSVSRPDSAQAEIVVKHEKARDEEPQSAKHVEFRFAGAEVVAVVVRAGGPPARAPRVSTEEQVKGLLAVSSGPLLKQQIRQQLRMSGQAVTDALEALLAAGVVEALPNEVAGALRSVRYRLTTKTSGPGSDGRTAS